LHSNPTRLNGHATAAALRLHQAGFRSHGHRAIGPTFLNDRIYGVRAVRGLFSGGESKDRMADAW
jgi:hypothetical protein